MEGLVSVLDRGQALQLYLASYVVPVVDVGFQISLESFKCLPVPTEEDAIGSVVLLDSELLFSDLSHKLFLQLATLEEDGFAFG